MKKLMEKHRALALLVCVVFAAMLLLGTGFTVFAAGHHCAGHGCTVCQQAALVREGTRLLGLAMLALLFVLLCADKTRAFARIREFFALPQRTLVAENVRLNN